MICPNCGKETDDKAFLCQHCGKHPNGYPHANAQQSPDKPICVPYPPYPCQYPYDNPPKPPVPHLVKTITAMAFGIVSLAFAGFNCLFSLILTAVELSFRESLSVFFGIFSIPFGFAAASLTLSIYAKTHQGGNKGMIHIGIILSSISLGIIFLGFLILCFA